MQDRPLRILYLLSDPTWRFRRAGAGYSTHVGAVVEALRAAGHHVELLDTRRGAGESPSDTPRAAELSPDTLRAAARPRRSPPWQALLPRRLRAMGRDISYLASNRRVEAALAPRLAEGEFDLVYERFHHMQSAGVRLARRAGVPIIVEYNAGQHEIVEFQEKGLVSVGQRLERWILNSADRVITVSEVLRARLIADGIPAQRIVTQHNGVDVELFDPRVSGRPVRSELGLDDRTCVAGFVGSLTRWQGVELLIDAVAGLRGNEPPVCALIVGGDRGSPRHRALAARAQERGVAGQVMLVGRVPFERVPDYVAAMDVATLPWTADYTSPIKLFEYMAMGKALVVGAQPNMREILVDGESALLTERTPESLARALATLAGDRGERQRLGAAARKAAEERHTWDRHAALVARLHAEIAAEAALVRR